LPAPYTIVQAGNAFTLARNNAVGAPTPTAEELGLANAINSRLKWVQDNPTQLNDPAVFIAALRTIAESGLTQDQGRDIVAARQTLTIQFPTQPAPGKAAGGPFRVYLDAGEIMVERIMDSPDPAEDQRKFLGELIQQERMVRALYDRGTTDAARRTQRLQSAIQRLAWAAGLGLEGQLPDVVLARLAVQGVLADAIQENGTGVRGAYLRELAWAYGVACTILLFATVAFYVGSRCVNASQAFLVPGETLSLMDVALLSLSLGAWMIAAYRLQPDSPEILDNLFNTTTSSSIRAILVLGFGFFGLLLFYKQVVVFSFGPSGGGGTANGFTTALVFSKLSTAVLAGGLLGIGDVALPSAVIARSANLVAALAPH
jgi:hypothetical protein